MADIAHVAGMVATGIYPSPVNIADVTAHTTTHKTLTVMACVVVCHHGQSKS